MSLTKILCVWAFWPWKILKVKGHCFLDNSWSYVFKTKGTYIITCILRFISESCFNNIRCFNQRPCGRSFECKRFKTRHFLPVRGCMVNKFETIKSFYNFKIWIVKLYSRIYWRNNPYACTLIFGVFSYILIKSSSFKRDQFSLKMDTTIGPS